MKNYIVQTCDGSQWDVIASGFDVDGAAVTFLDDQGRKVAYCYTPQFVAVMSETDDAQADT